MSYSLNFLLGVIEGDYCRGYMGICIVYLVSPLIMENQMEKKMENEMETAI